MSDLCDGDLGLISGSFASWLGVWGLLDFKSVKASSTKIKVQGCRLGSKRGTAAEPQEGNASEADKKEQVHCFSSLPLSGLLHQLLLMR